jgi:hypothetical protein
MEGEKMKRLINNLLLNLFGIQLFKKAIPPIRPNKKVHTVMPDEQPQFNSWLNYIDSLLTKNK